MARLAQLLLLAALLGGAWWLGARMPTAQVAVLALSGLALFLAAIATSLDGQPASRYARLALLPVGLWIVFLLLQVFRIANPAFVVRMDGETWNLIPLTHKTFLPAGFNAPFDGLSENLPPFTNPLRHLLIFGAAFCATAAAFLLAKRDDLRRGFITAFVVQATLFSIVSIVHRLSGAQEVLWFYTDREFWMGSPIFPYKNTAAAYQILLLGFCFAAFRSVRERTPHSPVLLWLIGLTAALAFVALLLLNCRAGVVMGFLLALLFVVKEWTSSPGGTSTRSRAFAVVAIAVLAIGAGAVLVFGGFGKTLQRFESELADPLALLRGGKPRIEKQRIAVEMAKDRPWFGWGGGAYLPLFLSYHSRNPEFLRALRAEQPTASRIHQASADGDWWEFAVEYGLIGTALLAGIVATGLVLWWKMDGLHCVPSLYLIAAAVLVVLHGFIEQVLRDPIALATLGATVAFAIRTTQQRYDLVVASQPRRRRRRSSSSPT